MSRLNEMIYGLYEKLNTTSLYMLNISVTAPKKLLVNKYIVAHANFMKPEIITEDLITKVRKRNNEKKHKVQGAIKKLINNDTSIP